MGARPHSYRLTTDGPLRLFSTLELLFMDPPEWLVEDIMPEGALVGLYAPPESLKSFLAIDFAMCVATGKPWKGHDVKKGNVVYISAEGGAGIGKRVFAWLTEHQVEPQEPRIAWITETVSVNADSVEMAMLLERLQDELKIVPSLIVIDTLARCFAGNENEQEDMGKFIAGIDMLRKQFGCTVLVVHHTRLDGERERGNTAFRGAADTMIALSRDGDTLDVICAKQKDAEHFADLTLEKVVVEGTGSCVLAACQTNERRAQHAEQLLGVLRAKGPMLWKDWVTATGLTLSDFMKRFQAVKQGELAVKRGDGRWGVVDPPSTPPTTQT